MPEFYTILARKPENYQNTRIFIIFARKINKIPEFYMIFARKMPEFSYTLIIARNYFPRILGGTCPPSSLAVKNKKAVLLQR